MKLGKKTLLLSLVTTTSLCALGTIFSLSKKNKTMSLNATNEKTVTLTSFNSIKSQIKSETDITNKVSNTGRNINVPTSNNGSYVYMTYFSGDNMRITWNDGYLVNGQVTKTTLYMKLQMIFNLQNVKKVSWSFVDSLDSGSINFSPTSSFYDSSAETYNLTSSTLKSGSYTCKKQGQSFVSFTFQKTTDNMYYRMKLESLSFTYDYGECVSSLS